MYEESVIVLVNASYHTASDTKRAMEKLRMNVSFLSPYSPVFAPVEQFSKLTKSKIRSFWKNSMTNFSSKAETKAIAYACESISHESMQKIWSVFILNLIYLIVE